MAEAKLVVVLVASICHSDAQFDLALANESGEL